MDGVTIATLVVAGTTFLLALATFRLGSRAAEETRAQWRPVLLVRARRFSEDRKIRLDPVDESLTVEIENVGRGPALDVTATGTAGIVPAVPNRISAMAPGEVALLDLPLAVPHTDAIVLQLSYGDISHAGYGTGVVIDITTPSEPNLIAQNFVMRGPITFWWERIVPRRFRRHLWPVAKRTLRRRGYTIP